MKPGSTAEYFARYSELAKPSLREKVEREPEVYGPIWDECLEVAATAIEAAITHDQEHLTRVNGLAEAVRIVRDLKTGREASVP